jgi:hypothetical protein
LLALPLFTPFFGFAVFPSLSFGLLAVLHGSWIQISNFVLFIVNVLIKGEIEKLSGQYLGLICDE